MQQKKTAEWGASSFVILIKYCWEYHIMEKGMGSACGSHRTEQNSKYGFSMVPYREQGRDHLEDLGTDVGVILKWILKK